MAVVEAKPEKKSDKPAADRVDERIMKPGDYEVTPETTFEVEVHLRKSGSRWVVVEGAGKDIVTHKVVFRMWTYDEMVEMRKMSTTYDSVRRVHMIDNDALNRLKVQKLMVSWTFGDDNPRLKMHKVQGVLTDESWETFKKLQPNIISHILERANGAYEFNG